MGEVVVVVECMAGKERERENDKRVALQGRHKNATQVLCVCAWLLSSRVLSFTAPQPFLFFISTHSHSLNRIRR